MAFGAILFWEIARFFLNGWVETVYIAPPFHFTYWGFSWVRPLPDWAMYLVFFCVGLASAFVCLGLFYRIAIVAVFLSMTYIFLLEKAVYLNHAYLICLISFLMMFIPAHRRYSFDARRRPQLRSGTISAGCLWILRFQIGLPYFYGGIAKINPDWLQGQPMQLWLMNEAQSRSSIPGLDSI
ncbi:MAG: HTTM domain-containing protein [Planctomycetaceae bacterium]|nr:HTTM domain-containing protein [Planctomycetaceae bacterium]